MLDSITALHLFAYGTLMCPEIFAEVTGLHRSGSPAALHGFRRVRVKNEVYPALIPDPEAVVSGVVYHDLSLNVWTRLDRFEGEMYRRMTVEVRLRDGSVQMAQTYVTDPRFIDCLEDADWSFDDFLSHGKKIFQATYRGFRERT